MIRMCRTIILLAVCGLFTPGAPAAGEEGTSLITTPVVEVLELNGRVDSTKIDRLETAIQNAQNDRAQLLLLRLNVWNGSLDETRRGMEAIARSKVPVVGWMFKPDEQMGGSGAWWLLAAHWSAMAPGTSLNLAPPQAMMDGRHLDAEENTEQLRGLMSIVQRRGQNAVNLLTSALDEGKVVTAARATNASLIDGVFVDQKMLLGYLDGRETGLADGSRVRLELEKANVKEVGASAMDSVTSLITNPNIAYLLLLSGLLLLLFEIFHPGGILPGVLGFIFAAAGLIGLGTLPLNGWGLALIILAMVLFFLEIKLTSWGTLAVGGLVSMIFGSFILVEHTGEEFPAISPLLIIGASVIMLAFFVFVLSKGLQIQLRKAVTGMEGMLGEEGQTTTETDSESGKAMVRGEYWDAVAERGTITAGEQIVVVGHDRFKLIVKKKRD
jgi:membrane-bound serine protease (ClpP class)